MVNLSKPDSDRAREVLCLVLLGLSNKHCCKMLRLHPSTVQQQISKWLTYYCGTGEHARMRTVVIKAIDDGTRTRLFRKFADHSIIGPLITQWREGK